MVVKLPYASGGLIDVHEHGDLLVHDGTQVARLPIDSTTGDDSQAKILRAESAASNGLLMFWDTQTPLTTKGDLMVMSGVPARLPLGTPGAILVPDLSDLTFNMQWYGPGSDGEVLAADSSVSRGLSWQVPVAAYAYASMDGDGSNTTGVVLFGDGSTETVLDSGHSTQWSTGISAFEIGATGVYEISGVAVLDYGSSGIGEITLHVNNSEQSSIDIYLHNAMDPFAVPFLWVESLSVNDTVGLVAYHAASSRNWAGGSTVRIKRLS